MKEKTTTKNGAPLALVIGMNFTSRLTMTRAAGWVGCDVVQIKTDRLHQRAQKIDQQSKYVVGWRHCPEPDRQLLIDTIMQYAGTDRKPVLIPIDDYAAATLDEHLDRLSPHFLMPHVDHRQGGVVRIMDKSLQKTVARSVGLPVAEGWVCRFRDGRYELPEGVRYPCFFKAMESYSAAQKDLQQRCDTPEQLQALLDKAASKYRQPFLIEEYVPIEHEYAVLGLSLGDRAIIPVCIEMTRGLRGVTATGRIFPISELPGLEKGLAAFMRETRLTGLFDIDIYESGGKIYFNELNTRFGASGFALVYGVANLPGMFVRYLLGEKDIAYDGPARFTPKTFANAKVVRDMYYEGIITLKEYKRLSRSVDVHSLKYEGDNAPYRMFARRDLILPLWRQLRIWKRKWR